LSGYCDIAQGHEWHGPYHDTEYGFPIRDEAVLFERLILEINQAGLSWLTILKKRDGFTTAYDGFDVDRVADYGPKDRERLLNDAGIIRNRLKVDAAISNAQRIREMRDSHSGFANWLDGTRNIRFPGKNGSSCSRRHFASRGEKSPIPS
jgi:DNA-3-methyladenine glycosylase I